MPGTGQKIHFRDVLKEYQPEVLIIPPQWCINDILLEMRREEITVGQILVEEGGRLIKIDVISGS